MKPFTRYLLLSIFAWLFVSSASAFYDPRMGRWLSRDPIGEDGGFNLYAYCGNDPVNRHDPLGLQAWGSMEDAQRINSGVRSLMDGGFTDALQQLEREVQETNQKVASGQIGLLEGIGTRVIGKADKLLLSAFLAPWAYRDAAREYGTYNPGEIIFHQGIVNGVVVNGSQNVYRAFQQPNFEKVMNVFDSGVDATLVWKGGETTFGRNRLPNGVNGVPGTGSSANIPLETVQALPSNALTIGARLRLRIRAGDFTPEMINVIKVRYTIANFRLASRQEAAAIGNQVPYSSYLSRKFVRDTMYPTLPVSAVRIPIGFNVDEFVSRQFGGRQIRENQSLLLERINKALGPIEENAATVLPDGTVLQGFDLEFHNE